MQDSRNLEPTYRPQSLFNLLMLIPVQWLLPGMGHSSCLSFGGGAEIESLNLPKNSAVGSRAHAYVPRTCAAAAAAAAAAHRACALPILFPLADLRPTDRPTDIHHYIVMPDRFRGEMPEWRGKANSSLGAKNS